jgi:uncharacterized protein YeaO (DUF488 family)
MGQIKIKRIYETVSKEDGVRLLVDRLWPRGISKERASLTEWLPEVAPTTVLRKWFSHNPAKWKDFKEKYLEEIRTNNSESILKLTKYIKDKDVITLLYSTKDEIRNNAIVLKEHFESKK